MEIKFYRDSLTVELNCYTTKLVNVYIVYDLEAWTRDSANNLKFKNCLFGAANTVKICDKEKWL